MISIVHVGLRLDHPSIPAEERPKVAKRLKDLQQRMRSAGYGYQIVCCSPEDGLESFKQLLIARPCDAVLLGGGVAGNPEMKHFMQQIVDAAREAAPRAKIMFHDHSIDPRETVERCFKPEGSPPAASGA